MTLGYSYDDDQQKWVENDTYVIEQLFFNVVHCEDECADLYNQTFMEDFSPWVTPVR